MFATTDQAVRVGRRTYGRIAQLLDAAPYASVDQVEWLRRGHVLYVAARSVAMAMARTIARQPSSAHWARAKELQDAVNALEATWLERCAAFVEHLEGTPCGGWRDLRRRLGYLAALQRAPGGIRSAELPTLLENIQNRLELWEGLLDEEVLPAGRLHRRDTSRTPLRPVFITDPASRRFRS